MLCPLCSSSGNSLFHTDKHRHFYKCAQCHLVFVPPEQYITKKQEKAEYDLHENDVLDLGYRQFLSRLTTPLCEKIPAPALGLDFGCGPGPALATILREQDYSISLFDIFYDNNEQVWQETYDFITATEVIEHLHNPHQEITRLFKSLKPSGWLGIMTKQVKDQESFKNWHYKNDPTHVCFYSNDTFNWIGKQYSCNVEFIGKDVILLQKKKTPNAFYTRGHDD